MVLNFCSGPPAFSQQQLQQRQCWPFRPTAAALLRPATTALPATATATAAATAASTGSPIVCFYACLIAYETFQKQLSKEPGFCCASFIRGSDSHRLALFH